MPVVVASAHLLGRTRLVILAGVEACLAGVALSSGAGEVVRDPPMLAVHTVALMMVATVVGALADSDGEHRSAATMDPLTGLLNRHGLAYEALFADADAALYRAKVAGRDRVDPAPGVPLAPA